MVAFFFKIFPWPDSK